MPETALIPEHLKTDELTKTLASENYQLVSRGKSRDTYLLSERRLLAVYTDRISLGGFILSSPIPRKGEVSAALTHFWTTNALPDLNHNVIRSYNNFRYNAAYDLQAEGFLNLPLERCLVIKNEQRGYPFVMTYRHYMDDSIFDDYKKHGKVCGHELPAGFKKWERLSRPLFTPTRDGERVKTKNYFIAMNTSHWHGDHLKISEDLRVAYLRAHNYADRKGVIILKTNFKVSNSEISGDILTPDSTSFILEKEWERAMYHRDDPKSFDKEFLIDWAKEVETPFGVIGINNLNPKNPDHQNFVHTLPIPEEVVNKTSQRHIRLFELLAGKDLNQYQAENMGVKGRYSYSPAPEAHTCLPVLLKKQSN